MLFQSNHFYLNIQCTGHNYQTDQGKRVDYRFEPCRQDETMIIGSGLVANAMAPAFASYDECLVFASGVSNSHCIDSLEYQREQALLEHSLAVHRKSKWFIYFSTCSVYDPDRSNTPYVRHKLAMEALVSHHPGYLIVRLPQLAGKSTNQHTLLNYLYFSIKRNISLTIWTKARRNIIDSEDAARIVSALVKDGKHPGIVNIANTRDYTLMEIVKVFETLLGKTAAVEFIDRGAAYTIDVDDIIPYVRSEGIQFDDGYLERVLRKYYEEF